MYALRRAAVQVSTGARRAGPSPARSPSRARPGCGPRGPAILAGCGSSSSSKTASQPARDERHHRDLLSPEQRARAGRGRPRRGGPSPRVPVPGVERQEPQGPRHAGEVERRARRCHRHLHARDPALRLRADHQRRQVRLRADGHLRRVEPRRSRQGAVPGPGGPDDGVAPVPQQAELRTGRDPGHLRRQRARSQGGHVLRAGADQGSQRPHRGDRRARRGAVVSDPRRRGPPAGHRHRHPGDGQRRPEAAHDPAAAREHGVGLLQPGPGQEAGRAALLHAAALHLTRMRAGDRRRRPGPASLRQPGGLHPRGGLRGQPAQQGPAPAARGRFTCGPSRGCS